MQLTLLASALLSHPPDVLAGNEALAKLAACSEAVASTDADSALLDALGIDAAAAPLAALGAGLDVGARWVVRADPVTITVGHQDVRLDARVDDLDAAEAQTLKALLSRHFASDPLSFEAPRADAWFASSAQPFDLATTPLAAALGRPLRTLLPSGRDAATWRRWLTEAQMLVHEHPLSLRAQHPVTGIWFSAGGTLPDAAGLPSLSIHAAAGRHGDLARGLARHAGNECEPAASLRDALAGASGADHVLMTLPAADSSAARDAALHDVVAPAVDALLRGDLECLALIADGAGMAATWRARRPTLLQRLRRRRQAFAVPAAEDRQ